MIRKIFISFVCLSLVFVINTKAENEYIDSLLNLVKKTQIDTTRVKLYNDISIAYQSINAEKAINYAREAWKISKRVDYTYGLGNSFLNLGKGYEVNGEYKKAIEHFTKAIERFNDSTDHYLIGDAEKHIGISFEYQGKYDVALTHYLKAIKKMEIADDKLGRASCLLSIGNIYYFQDDFKTALGYFKKTLVITKEIDNKYATGITLNNIGNVFDKLEDYDAALDYFKEAYEIHNEIGNYYGVGYAVQNIGNIYNRRDELTEALSAYDEAIEIQEEIGDQVNVARNYTNKAVIYQKMNMHNKALEYCDLSLELQIELNNKEGIKYVYDIKRELFADQGNWQAAYNSYTYYTEYKDSLINDENKKVIAQLQEQFNAEKREQEIEILNKDQALKDTKINQQRNLIIIFVVVSIIILAFLIMLIRLFMQKRKANILLAEQNEEIRSQRDEIEAQRDEITAQRDLVTEQKEHIQEIHEELTSSIHYAERIQKAVLPSDEFLDQNIPKNFVLFKPHSVVSGDFYWATRIKNLAVFTAADCTGHGVPGAFMSMMGISFLNEIIRKKEINTASQVLDELRKNVVHALGQKGISGEQKDGMDISFCVLDMETNVLQWAGGNNSLYIISKHQFEIEGKTMESEDGQHTLYELKPDKMPIAIYEKMDKFTNNTIQLNKGDMIYMFSDGYADQFGGPKGKKFMYKPFKKILLENNEKSMSDQKTALDDKFEAWKAHLDQDGHTYEQIDDVVVLGVRI